MKKVRSWALALPDIGLKPNYEPEIRQAALAIDVGWVETIVKTQHLSAVCWVLRSRNPTYDYHQVIDFSFFI